MIKKLKTLIKKLLNISKSILIIKDIIIFLKLNDKRFVFRISDFKPMTRDKTSKTSFDLHYVYHPAWAARILAQTKPKVHIDISSTLHFSSILSAFIPIKFYDYRPADLFLDNFESLSADINSLPFKDGSQQSISCMHTVEHIGLGRYGDKIDPGGDLKAINELKRVTAIGGDILLVVPVGKPKIIFNAHRIYSYEQIVSYCSDLRLEEFSLISEKENKIILNADSKLVEKESYGCGCFWFKKI